MTIQYTPGSERKKLAAALAKATGITSCYAGAPTMAYIVGDYTISRDGTLTGPDNRELIAALRQQGFEPAEETYDSDNAQPEQPEPDKLTIEVPIGENWSPAKMNNLERLIASRESLLKKVLGTDTLSVEQTESTLKFPWFPVDDNAEVYGQLACALVRAATEATRITAKEKPAESEKFRMRTYLLKLGFIGDTYKQARKILLRGLSGSGSYARDESRQSSEVTADE